MLKKLVVPALALLLSFSAFAQVSSSELSGSVTDPSGAALANAKVIATNAGTGRNHETVSNASGPSSPAMPASPLAFQQHLGTITAVAHLHTSITRI